MRQARGTFVSWGFFGIASLVAAGCATDDVPPPRPVHGSIGEETFGVVCDRIGAQALTEDLTGDSYRGVCHKDSLTGAFADRVDEARLPSLVGGDPATGASTRAHALARIAALVSHRSDLIASLDAMFPGDVMLDVRDQGPACAPAGKRALSEELARVLARMAGAYDDGTVPQVTRALGRFSDAIAASPDAQAALAQIGARKGYRPEAVALGIARPVLAYPRLRELTNATLALVSPDSDPYAASPSSDATGARVAVPGPAYAKLAALGHVASLELRTAKAGAPLLPAVVQHDADASLDVPSRPRSKLEVLAALASAKNEAFGSGDPRFIVRRDLRGIAQPQLSVSGAIAAPFADVDHDGLADVDPFGQLVMLDGRTAPSPFAVPQRAVDPTPREADGRAKGAADGTYLYDYIDTSHAYAASLMNDVASLVDGDGKNEPLMDALAGTYVLFGSRDGAPASTRAYDGTNERVNYDAFHGDQSPLVDLVYAVGQTLADPNLDATLDASQWLMTNDEADLARTTGAALAIKRTSDAHAEAKLPAQSTLWDELIDVLVKIAAVTDADGSPGLLQGMLEGLADDHAKDLGTMLAAYSANRDALDYDRTDINGPPINVTSGVKNGPLGAAVDRTQADQGLNRSVFQRFLQLVHDTRGVQVCNRAGAKVKALMDVPVLGGVDVSIPDSPLVTAFWGKSSFGECEVFHIDDMARFYLESIVGKSQYVLRDAQLRDGVAINFGVAKLDVAATATTVHLLERSCDLTGYQPDGTTDPAARTGFWTPSDSKLLMSRPEWLNRNLFFPNGVGGDKPARAKAFSDALNPDHAGTAVCPTRTIADPLSPSDPNYVPGGKITLPACADGDWLDQRDPQTIFALEQTKFYPAIAPLIQPFADRKRSDLLVELLDVLHRHWADENGSASDCRLSGAPGAKGCSKDGVVRYEPILADAFAGDLLPALQSVVRTLKTADAKSPTFWLPCASKTAAGLCVGAHVTGTRALAYALKSTVDPDQATTRNLVDRRGVKSALRNDGTTNVQITPIYLVTSALASMDRAFADFAAKNPSDAGRQAQWRSARTKIVDRFFTASSHGGDPRAWRFDDAALPKITPIAITLLRQELRASCPEWPSTACAWAGHDIAARLSDAISGPLFASSVDLVDTLRRNDGARLELEKLVAYLLDSKSGSDALQSLLVAATDGTQMLQDDRNLVPLFHAIAPAIAASADDPTQRGLLDATVALLTRLTAEGHTASGGADCSNEIDPNQVLTRMLQNSVTPLALGDARTLTPIEVVLDTIADVNRAAPESNDAFRYDDYASIASNVSDFLLDKQRGIEQFYAIVRNATR